MKKGFATIICLFILQELYCQSGNWRLTKVRDGQNLVEVNSQNTAFIISIKKNVFKGNVGCNTFKGKLEYSKDELISPIILVTTNMACPDYVDALDFATISQP